MEFDPSILNRLLERIEILGAISESEHQLTRSSFSPAMRQANDAVSQWMLEAGMELREDPMGNVIGRYGKGDERVIIGSHLDTARNAGKYDGALGLLLGIASVEQLAAWGIVPSFEIEIVSFADSEGIRFQTSQLSSRYYAGQFDEEDAELLDYDGEAGETLRWL